MGHVSQISDTRIFEMPGSCAIAILEWLREFAADSQELSPILGSDGIYETNYSLKCIPISELSDRGLVELRDQLIRLRDNPGVPPFDNRTEEGQMRIARVVSELISAICEEHGLDDK